MLEGRLILSLAERLSSKFHICPRSFASRPNVHFKCSSLSRGHYQPTYQPPEGIYLLNIQKFSKLRVFLKDLKDNKDNGLHLGRKYARLFVLGHYLFLVGHNLARALLSENCSLLGTDNARAYFLAKWRLFNNYSMSPRWIWRDKITNEPVARVGYNHFISNKGEWNNCFSKFSNRVLPPIFISTILQRENF